VAHQEDAAAGDLNAWAAEPPTLRVNNLIYITRPELLSAAFRPQNKFQP
jgi:hypothetical protein